MEGINYMPLVNYIATGDEGETSQEAVEENTSEDANVPMEITVKHLDSRFDRQGYQQITESGPPKKSKIDKWAKYALCLTRNFDRDGNYMGTQLQIKSPHIKAILKKVITDYPGISFNTKEIKVPHPVKCLFYYRAELQAEVKTLEGEAREHGNFFVQFVEDEFEEIFKEHADLLAQELITYDLLWTIFKPGALLYTSIHQQPHCFSLVQGQAICGQQPHYALQATQTEFNGKQFGARTGGIALAIPAFAGTRPIAGLPVMPLNFHPAEQQIRELLVARGRRFEELAHKEFLEYEGLALGEIDHQRGKQVKYHVNGRVYIDAETYFRINANRSINIAPYAELIPEDKHEKEDEEDDLSDNGFVPVNMPPPFPGNMPPPFPGDMAPSFPGQPPLAPPARSRRRRPARPAPRPLMYPSSGKEVDNNEKKELLPLTDEQCLTASALVRGFDFSSKKWLEFLIPNLSPIVWNEAAFSRLVLPASQKKLVHSLVQSNLKHSSSGQGSQGGFDDVIKGKGKGLVLVLHGPPGSGKTLTAEATAELTHRPLYTVSSGELGTEVFDLEQKLSQILDVASTWRCVLLLDEADVFLEKRSMHDLHRNALVSIFLRLLEYYTGILFLTTNRVTTFDPAFQSRIHVALKYEELGQEARKSVWRGFLDGDIDEKGLKKLSERKANGREIKNAVKICKSLAEMEEGGSGKVELQGLLEVLDMRGAFERDFHAEET